ncbi:hypothetical protein [Desulfosarcina sp.]|uniref:hypothetical protein n=1 Tax=Desulfosarcina sp. TaxID=2027861 RepID=UPI003565770E
MKTKTLLISLVIAVFANALVSSSAMAGSKQRHRWEGVAIGVGAAILGHAIYQTHKAGPQPQVVYVEPEQTYRPHDAHKHRHGHWAWQKTWVPPTYERVWNPGHYNRKGHWVSGHWLAVETSSGHWTQERVWVADNRGPY